MDILDYKTLDTYRAICQVLRAFYTETLRDIVQNRGINLDEPNNVVVWAALDYMRDVSENPQTYFSRAATEDDWNLRAIEYKKNKKSPLVDAYGSKHIVDDPADVVYKNVLPCIMNEVIARNYRDFCKLVMNWEYSRTENDYHVKRAAINQQEKIIDYSKLASELMPNKKFNFDSHINALYGGKRR